MATSAPAPPSRLREFFLTSPLVTSSILVICVFVFVLDNVLDFGEALATTAVSPSTVFGQLQLYRVVTAAFTHGGVLHVGMNMLSLVSLGSSLEPLFGSLGFFFLTLLYTVLVGFLFCCLGAVVSLGAPSYWYASAVGFSGVLFAFAVDETSLSPAPTRSVFGLFAVPTKLYPWVLMALLQVLLPNVSLLGHLAGILVGLCHSAGLLAPLLPSAAALRRVEGAWLPPALVRLPPYRLAPPAEPAFIGSGGWAALCAPLAPLWRWAAQGGGALLARARGSGAAAAVEGAPVERERAISANGVAWLAGGGSGGGGGGGGAAGGDGEARGGEGGERAPFLSLLVNDDVGGVGEDAITQPLVPQLAAPPAAAGGVAAAETRARAVAALEARAAAAAAVGRPSLAAAAAAAAEKVAAAVAAEAAARAAAASGRGTPHV
jgi:membrane associated rhomboid family serine protease